MGLQDSALKGRQLWQIILTTDVRVRPECVVNFCIVEGPVLGCMRDVIIDNIYRNGIERCLQHFEIDAKNHPLQLKVDIVYIYYK